MTRKLERIAKPVRWPSEAVVVGETVLFRRLRRAIVRNPTVLKGPLVTLACLAAILVAGCKPSGKTSAPSLAGSGAVVGDGEQAPSFSLAWSEYPSWSVFGVADELGLVDGAEGAQGEIEKRHGVDIVLREAGYDSCLNMFTASQCDAVCITNMDALIISPSRDCVAVLPTSTSRGADACIVTEEVKDIEGLKGHKIYGLKGTVSEYCFVRAIEESGFQEEDFQFTNQDPAVAATNMQQSADSHRAIMVWNPFVLQTLNDRSDTRVLFDSSLIPGEIVDMVVVGKDVLVKPGSDHFIAAVIETFYRVNQALDDPSQGDEVLVALGKKFSNLGLEDMKLVVEQTVFYKTPQQARQLMEGDGFRETMKTVEEFCIGHGLISKPSVGYGDSGIDAKLRFESSYIK